MFPSGLYKQQLAEILFGIVQDGSGIEIVGGHIRPVPPSGPPKFPQQVTAMTAPSTKP
jgi:hypothetical protein